MLSLRSHLTGLIAVSSLHVVLAVQKVAKEELSVVRVQEQSEDRRRTAIAAETKHHFKGLHHKQHDIGHASNRTIPGNHQDEELSAKLNFKRLHHKTHDIGHASNRMNLVEAITKPNGAISTTVSLGRERGHLVRNGKLHLENDNPMHAVEVDPSGDVTDETALFDMAHDNNDEAEPTPVTPPVAPLAVVPPVADAVGTPPAVAAPAVATPVAATPTVAPPLAAAATAAPPVAAAPVGTPQVTAAPVAGTAPVTGAAPVEQPAATPFVGTVFLLVMFLVAAAVVTLGCWRVLTPLTNWRRTSSLPSRADGSASPRASFSPWQSSVPRSSRGRGGTHSPSDRSASEGTSPWQPSKSVPRSPRGKGPDQSSAGFLDPGWTKPHRPYRMKDATSTEEDERKAETVADRGGGRN